MKTRIRFVGVALAVSVVGAGALSASTTCAVDVLGDEVAELVVERCGSSPAAGSSNRDVVSDLLADLARNQFAPVVPIMRAP
jgi:hypothetical protein